MMDIRPSAIAGTWYPAEPSALHELIQELIRNAGTRPISGKIWGVIVPHAGYSYSGAVAANAFASLHTRQFDVVAVLCPYHPYHHAPILTCAHQAYRTPLGTVEIDRELLAALDDRLATQFGAGLLPVRYDSEHSLEIQIPFLQQMIGDFLLLPVMLRTQDRGVLKGLGHLLAEILAGKVALLVASSDLSHFHHPQVAKQLDAEILRRIETFDPDAVLSAETEGVGYACGAGAIAAVLWGARELGADRASLTGYATSGDRGGDREGVVGYGSAVLWEQAAA